VYPVNKENGMDPACDEPDNESQEGKYRYSGGATSFPGLGALPFPQTHV
jgi:hypothetical protein